MDLSGYFKVLLLIKNTSFLPCHPDEGGTSGWYDLFPQILADILKYTQCFCFKILKNQVLKQTQYPLLNTSDCLAFLRKNLNHISLSFKRIPVFSKKQLGIPTFQFFQKYPTGAMPKDQPQNLFFPASHRSVSWFQRGLGKRFCRIACKFSCQNVASKKIRDVG
jgi:hypothetical protein